MAAYTTLPLDSTTSTTDDDSWEYMDVVYIGRNKSVTVKKFRRKDKAIEEIKNQPFFNGRRIR